MIVDCALYEHGLRRPGPLDPADVRASFDDKTTFVWLGLHNPTAEEFDEVARHFDLHPLAVEDALAERGRPRLALYDDCALVVLKTARYDDADESVHAGSLDVFLGEGFLVTVRHHTASPLQGARQGIERRHDLLAHGPGAALYAIVDRVVDDYAPVLAGLDNDIEEIEQEVFAANRGDNPVERIYFLRKEIVELRAAMVALLEVVQGLRSHKTPWVHADLDEYFDDVIDHLSRYLDRATGQREAISAALDANLTRVGVRQNQDMRKISAWAAILAVPTAIAGVYGMNFEYMPELKAPWGYPVVLAVMASACAYLYSRFKRSGWL